MARHLTFAVMAQCTKRKSNARGRPFDTMTCSMHVHNLPPDIRLPMLLHLGGYCGAQPAHKTCEKSHHS